MSGFRKAVAVLAAGAASVAAGVVGLNLVKDVQHARAREEVELSREQLATVQDLSGVFRSVGKAVSPSVVHIVVQKNVKTGPHALPFDDDLLRRFFPDRDGDGKPDVPEGFGDGSGPDDLPFERS